MHRIALWLFLLCHTASAHMTERHDLDTWFSHLEARGGGLCCGLKDGRSLQDPDWQMAGGHYQVWLEGAWIDVPDNALVTVPNQYGLAIVWIWRNNGVLQIRCFLPGAGG